MDLTNASAIVTGGAGGFGSATVRRLAQKGAKVVIADVSDERGEALAREVGSGSLYVSTDCMDEDAIAKAVKAAAGYVVGTGFHFASHIIDRHVVGHGCDPLILGLMLVIGIAGIYTRARPYARIPGRPS